MREAGYGHKPGQFRVSLVPRLCLGMRSQRLRLDFWVHAGMRVVWRLTFKKWKAEPSGMHSHAEHGNEEALAILSRFVFVAEMPTFSRLFKIPNASFRYEKISTTPLDYRCVPFAFHKKVDFALPTQYFVCGI